MNNGVTVDASQVLRMFSELNSRQQKNVYKNALRKAGRILQKETKTQLRSVVGKTINHKNRGRMNASHFFRTAKDNKERAIFDNINQMVEESITRISKRR